MLFLGAGASKPLGIPTMVEFTEKIFERLDSPFRGVEYEPIISGIQATVRKFGFNPDIEAVLSVLQGRIDHKKALSDLGPLVTVFAKEYRNESDDTWASVGLTEIEKIIHDICMEINHSLAVKLYGELWDHLRQTLRVRMSRDRVEWVGENGMHRIFTTNYDPSVETFLKNRAIGFDEGFHQDTVGDIAFDGTWTQGPVHLFKLHGSVNYYTKEDGKVVRSDAPIEATDFFGRRVRGRMMIYPIGEKYATRSPFYEYLGQLRQALKVERVCIVIGYSFRDMPINNAFLDAVQKNPELRILLLGPSADRIRDRLDTSLQPITRAMNGNFGTNTMSPEAIAREFEQWPVTN